MSGQVEMVISPSAFSISDADDSSVEELLIVNKSGTGDKEAGVTVKVTGIVYRGFSVADRKRESNWMKPCLGSGRATPASWHPKSTPKSNTRVII